MSRVRRRPLQKLLVRSMSTLQRRFARRFDVVGHAQRACEDKFFQASPESIAGLLEGKRLQVFDVGARDGIEPGWAPYRHLIDATLAEPDPDEAARLAASGFQVIPSLIGGTVGRGVLNLCEKGGCSSTLEPAGAFLDFYAGGDTARFRVVQRVELPVTTVAAVVDQRGIPFDYLKLDTQGSELGIIEALGAALPLVIKSEISFVPLYQHSGSLFEIGTKLHELGYLLYHLAYTSRGSPARQQSDHPYQETAIPLHGDAWFCPDWTRPEGLALIRGRIPQYRALMRLFALDHVADCALAAARGAVAETM